jgi:hypothetical protein
MRLTSRNDEGEAQVLGINHKIAWGKLAAYEDTGIAPEKIEALQQEKENLEGALTRGIRNDMEIVNRLTDLTTENAELRKLLEPLQGKAALVLGVPESCMHCRLSMYLKYCGDVCKATLVNGEYAICPKTDHRPKWCPLMVVGGEK